MTPRAKLRFSYNVFRVLGCGGVAPNAPGCVLANRASKGIPAVFRWHVLEDRALTILIAICTYVMRKFAVAHGLLQRINHGPYKRGHQLVALLLSLPCFHASDFFFKCAYLLQ